MLIFYGGIKTATVNLLLLYESYYAFNIYGYIVIIISCGFVNVRCHDRLFTSSC